MDTRPIGFFDSGSGGLTIWQAVHAVLPYESTIYVGDHGYMPYSDKTVSYIRERGKTLIEFLIKKHAKMIVVACNTATVAGIDYFRQLFPDIPIVGVVPVVKTAARETKTHCFAVCSTAYTAKSEYIQNLIRTFAPHDTVYIIPSTHLVTYIESIGTKKEQIQEEIRRMMEPHLHSTMDVLVLGCTHFPFVKDMLQQCLGSHVMILDSGPAVARQVERILIRNAIGTDIHAVSTDTFFTTGDAPEVSVTMSHLLGNPIVVQPVHIA